MSLNNYIEHTILKPDATVKDIERLASDAIKHSFFGVCINPCYITLARELLKGTKVNIVTVVNFPLASNTIETTLFQVEDALKLGANEIDTVINIAELKNKNYKKVIDDIRRTKTICAHHNLKVILETDLLEKDEIKRACECAIEGGANFVKTSTGFVKGGIGAQVEDIITMSDIVTPEGLGVKASGGIKDYFNAKSLIDAGATRLGTSSGVNIILGES